MIRPISFGKKYEIQGFEQLKIEEKITPINIREYTPQIIEPKISQKAQESIQKTKLMVDEFQRATIESAYALINKLENNTASDEEIRSAGDLLIKLDKIATVAGYVGNKDIASKANRALNNLTMAVARHFSIKSAFSGNEIEKVRDSLLEKIEYKLNDPSKYHLPYLESVPDDRFLQEYDSKADRFLTKPIK